VTPPTKTIGVTLSLVCALSFALGGCEDKAEQDTVQLTISPRGGQLNHGPLTLTVPVGAVREPVEITVVLGGDETPDPGIVSRTLVSLQPDSLRFVRPVDLTLWFSGATLPSTANGDNTRLVKREGGSWVVIAGQTDVRRWASGSITELGTFAVRTTAIPPTPDSGPDGPATDAGAGDAVPDGATSDATKTDQSADQTSGDQASGDQASADQASADQGGCRSGGCRPGASRPGHRPPDTRSERTRPGHTGPGSKPRRSGERRRVQRRVDPTAPATPESERRISAAHC
jgi:hypothetical protein